MNWYIVAVSLNLGPGRLQCPLLRARLHIRRQCPELIEWLEPLRDGDSIWSAASTPSTARAR